MDDKEFLEKFFEEIRRLKDKDMLVIVEGFKDKNALQNFGIKNIKVLGDALYKVVEGITAKRAAILTDLDSEGKKIYARLKHDFQKRGIMADDKLRNLLFKSELRQIEGLDNYVQRLMKKTGFLA